MRCFSWVAVVQHEHYIGSNLQIDLPIVISHYFSFLERPDSLRLLLAISPPFQLSRKCGRSVAETDGFLAFDGRQRTTQKCRDFLLLILWTLLQQCLLSCTLHFEDRAGNTAMFKSYFCRE